MALDGATLHLIKNQLNNEAIGSRIERITMPEKDRIVLSLSAKGFSEKLLISCNPSSPKIHYTKQKFENPQTPPMICMLLRKKLTNGRLKGVRQAGMDRILFLDFECKNELSDDVVITLIVEIMGRLSNIIITENEKIIDCIRRFDPEEGKRFILPGAIYELPPAQDKINIIENEPNLVIEKLKNIAKPLDKALTLAIDGISPIIAREIAHNTLSDPQKIANTLNNYEYNKLESNISELKSTINSGGIPQIIFDENNTPKDFTFINITQYGSKYSSKICGSVSEMLDDFYLVRDTNEIINRKSSDMLHLLNKLSERIARKIANREKELQQTKDREKYRIYGELIKANLHLIKSGDSFVQCVNYYDENCAEIRIPLDIALSPSKNAQKYFKEYKKLSNASGMLSELIEDAKNELIYIESVFDSLCRAKSANDINIIRDELIETGYIKINSKNKRQKPQKSLPMKYLSSDGFEILVGKNNKQNDELTLKIADKRDLWLHTKEIAGSHVIVRLGGNEISDVALEQAATLAALHSKGSASRQVPVDYTNVKYVKKPAGAKPGMVIYTTNRTYYANPQDDAVLENIKQITN